MLKLQGTGSRNGKPLKLIVLGLSHQNLKRLKNGEPIRFAGEEVGVSDAEFLIFAGETEQAMAREMAEFVGPNTETRIDPRLKE